MTYYSDAVANDIRIQNRHYVPPAEMESSKTIMSRTEAEHTPVSDVPERPPSIQVPVHVSETRLPIMQCEK